MLQLAALLDSHGIPVGVFTAASARTYLADAQTGATADSDDRDEQVEPDDVIDALHNLHRLSLVTLTGSGLAALVRVHGLVQRAVPEHLSVEAVEPAALAVADGLLEIWPDADYLPELGVVAQSLRANTDALQTHCPAVLWTPDAHPLLFRSGRSRSDGGLLNQAIAYYEQLTDTAQRLLGVEHSDTLGSRNNLALAYQSAGRLGEAIPLHEQTLAACERVLGPEHPTVAVVLYWLASAQLALGHASAAARALRRAVAIDEAAYGDDHPEVATDLEALAVAQQNR